jgi:hypothetical protein
VANRKNVFTTQAFHNARRKTTDSLTLYLIAAGNHALLQLKPSTKPG